MFAFDSKGKTYLVTTLGGVTNTLFSLLLAQDTEKTLFQEKHSDITFRVSGKKKRHLNTCSTFRASEVSGRQWVSFLRKDPDHQAVELVFSDDLKQWKSFGDVSFFSRPPVYTDLPTEKRRRRIGAFVSTGRKHIDFFVGNKDFDQWQGYGTVLEGRASSFDVSHLEPIALTKVSAGLLLVYSAKNNENHVSIGAALLNPADPTEVLWRTSSPLWKVPHTWYGSLITFLGMSFLGKYGTLFLERPGHPIESFPIPKLWETYQLALATSKQHIFPATKKSIQTKKAQKSQTTLQLVRFHANPIIEPRTENHWEAIATFNTAAFSLDERIYLLYRAQGHNGHSVLGYAASTDGITIDERLEEPIYDPSNISGTPRTFSMDLTRYPYLSGGGTGGCEDPRITRIDDRLYLIYTAFDGMQPPGVALTSIAVQDFLAKRFHWKKPRLISRFGHIQKNWVIFPEKIGGKIAILHNVTPRIMIELVDELDAPTLVIDSCPPRQTDNAHRWDNLVRGAGAPPLRTEHGWLVLYHAMDAHDPNKYKVGAMLLDLDHPEIVLARSQEPILEPEEEYENHGHKWGVVFVCGAVIKDKTLFVYYGASDKTVAVATAPIESFLRDLKEHRVPQVKAVILKS